MAQFLSPSIMQVETASGAPLNGAKLYVYQVNTTTLLSLFSDEALQTPAANPVVADASGAFGAVFLAETKCKQILATSADVTVWTREVVYTTGVASNIQAADVSYDGAASGLASETVQDAIDEVVELQGGTQSWSQSADGPIATGESTNTGAAAGPLVEMYRNSATPAASNVIGGRRDSGKNSAGSKVTYTQDNTVIVDPTNGSEDGKRVIRTVVAGALADRLHIGAGTWGDGATGGDPGTGKANFSEVQQDGNDIRPIVRATAQATTSGTAFDFSSIPSWVKRIRVKFSGVSLSGTDDLIVQLGDSGGLETTSYASSSVFVDGSATGSATSTSGFIWRLANSARAATGQMTIEKIDGTTWLATHAGQVASGACVFGGGSKALSDVLDRLRITRTGTDTFDAGSVNISYE